MRCPVAFDSNTCESPFRISMPAQNIQSAPISTLHPSMAAISPPSIVKSFPIIMVLPSSSQQKEVLEITVRPPIIILEFLPEIKKLQLCRRAKFPISTLEPTAIENLSPLRYAPLQRTLLWRCPKLWTKEYTLDTIQLRMLFQYLLYFIHNLPTLPIIQFLFPDSSLQQIKTLFHSQRKYLASHLVLYLSIQNRYRKLLCIAVISLCNQSSTNCHSLPIASVFYFR